MADKVPSNISQETIENLNLKNFDSSISSLTSHERKYKDKNPALAKKCRASIEVFSDAKSKLEAIIKRMQTEKDPADPTKSYYDSLFAGVDKATLTYAKIGSVLTGKSLAISDFEDPTHLFADTKTSDVDLKTNFFDDVANSVTDSNKNKKRASVLAGTLISFSGISFLTKGITQFLEKKGIMKEAVDIVGLGKLGWGKLPALFSAVGSGFSAVWNCSPLGVILAATGVAVKAIPFFARKFINFINKFKGNSEVQKNFNDLVNGMAEANKAPVAGIS